MSRDTRLRVLCYDISEDRNRRAVARILEDHASRVQGSVFEARLSARAVERLVEAINPHLGDRDSLRGYTIGKSAEAHSSVHGAGVPIETETGYWLL